jgi:D-serine deaminase-like pyridoxal phosphate-dependent protein
MAALATAINIRKVALDGPRVLHSEFAGDSRRRTSASERKEYTTMLVDDLDTPCAVVDLDIMEANLRRCQSYFDQCGLTVRPHIKTHKIPEFARLQIGLGAKGITCQKLGEAEVMVDAGITDILLTYNVIGQTKLDRLVMLAHRAEIKVVADSIEVVDGLSAAMHRAGVILPVLVECETGAQRCGVVGAENIAALARHIDRSRALRFLGLMTYPRHNAVAETAQRLAEAAEACRRAGVPPQVISNGGTPDLYRAHEVGSATEHRPGTYIYSDRSLVESKGFGTWDDCALRIHATVVSHPARDRCVIDAGSKSLSSDLLGMTGYGRIIEHPEWEIAALSEEHGHVRVPQGAETPKIGERISIVPNHACAVSNLHDRIYAVRAGRVEAFHNVAARGRTQ